MNKETIKNNFSKYANLYDRYSSIQDLCAGELISKIDEDGFGRILDIGCGTGNYTKLLREKFPHASIKALDISEEMIDVARKKLDGERIDFLVADAETVNIDDTLDLISSNAVFHWFDDLGGALSRYGRLLKKRGAMAFSIFGPRTYCELDASLKELFGDDIAPTSCNFPEYNTVKEAMAHSLDMVKIEEETRREEEISLKALLTRIRYTGTRGDGIYKRIWTPKIMNSLECIYKKRFGGITATYQVFFCRGVR